MGIAKWICGRERGVSRRSNERRLVRPARATVPHGLENLETRQVLSAVAVSVPGTADPYLADPSPADPAKHLLAVAIADGTVPPSIPVTGSETLTITATGQTSNDPANPGGSPNGGGLISAANGSQGAISSWNLPLNSLVGVFLGDAPGTAPAPETGSLSATSVSPALGQVFFVGTGTTSDGQSVSFHVPGGATHLYLASLDGTQWDNNGGQFQVSVQVLAATPAGGTGGSSASVASGGVNGGASTLTVLVPGTADPYLADPANGSLGQPIADGTAPPSIPITGSETLTVKARGHTSNDPANPGRSPNGGYLISAAYGSQGPISSWNLPLNSLVGVFLGDDPGPAPGPFTGRLDATNVSPGLGQVFFIGSGTRSNGQTAKFHVPAGATHLYLASLDGTQWDNNGGQFQVRARVLPRFLGAR